MGLRQWSLRGSTRVATLFATSAHSETLITCGDSEAHAYYLSGDRVPAEKAEWQEYTVSGGNITLALNGTDFDVIYRDARGMSYSTRSDGVTVLLLNESAGRRMGLVIHRGAEATETYVFSPADKEVVRTQAKVNGLIDKAAVFWAPCN